MNWSEKVNFFNEMRVKDIPRTKEGRDFWRSLAESGEVPVERVYLLLDYIDELEGKLKFRKIIDDCGDWWEPAIRRA